jgi:SAM-dependent methyltransferase
VADPTRRFGDRAGAYARHRPCYPEGVLDVLSRECGVAPGASLADVGSGTGILTRMLLDAGYRVSAVEPNDAMRAEAEQALASRPGFVSVPGRAEATGLPDGSVDAVVVAQAFHWFDREAARAEFDRILRPGGRVLLVWNVRRIAGSAFMEGYGEVVRRHAVDPIGLTRRDDARSIAAFFGSRRFHERVFPHVDRLDREGLVGRATSASYMPIEGDLRRPALLADLEALFAACAHDGRVAFEYDTHVYF